MPGGKFDNNDKLLSRTAQRECEEETGICPHQLKVFYQGPSVDSGFYTYAFAAGWYGGLMLREGPEGKPMWGPMENLLISEYAPYYEIMFHYLERFDAHKSY